MDSIEFWAGLGSALVALLGLVTMALNHVEIKLLINKIVIYFSPYITITIPQYGTERFQRNDDLFVAIEAYLSDSCGLGARKFKAELGRDRKEPQFSVDDGQQILDTFVRKVTRRTGQNGDVEASITASTPLLRNHGGIEHGDVEDPRSSITASTPLSGDRGGIEDGGVEGNSEETTTVWWDAYTEHPRGLSISMSNNDEKRRFFRVTFHRSSHAIVLKYYLPHVLEQGRAIIARNRQRRLFTNNPSSRWNSREIFWSHVAFQHPANFETLAMDPKEKEKIKDDLKAFKNGKDFYTKVGKAWKRGYLLYGPPGTGKSTMIAAMANFLEYDVYDLELAAVKNNTELRKLFVETTEKSIIVIEDIDRSIDLTGKKKPREKSDDDSNSVTSLSKEDGKEEEDTKLTLSGVLNIIDGLWSACGGERIIVFTTNYKDKLDPALIRRGRMDMHIEMSYCREEAFNQLASNYLDINKNQSSRQSQKDKYSEVFQIIGELLKEVNMSPADVAEHLMRTEKRDADECLKGLKKALINAKDMAVKEKEKAKEEPEKSMDKANKAKGKVI